MRRKKGHCGYYTVEDTPSFNLKIGDCIKPVHGRFNPHKCLGICDKYNDTVYQLKRVLIGK
jgi:hypothetical protein